VIIMGRLTKLLVFSLVTALALPLLPGCGGSEKPRKKESAPKLKTDRPTAGPSADRPEEEAKPNGKEDSPEARLNKLIALLDSASATKRKGALNQLAAMKDKDLAKPALKPIRKCIQDANPQVRALAGLALLKLEGKEASYAIRPLLKDDSAEVRATVLNELGKLGKDFNDELMAGLDDKSPEIQEIVLDHLSRQNVKRADALAVKLFERTEVERLRAQVLAYLIRIKSDKGTAAVEKLMDDLDGVTLTLAVRYLGEYGKEAQVAKLADYLQDRVVGVRKEAAKIMAARKIKTRDAIWGLIRLLRDNQTDVRAAAHEALKKLTNQDFKFDPKEMDEKKVEPALEKWEAWMGKNEKKFPEQ